MSQNFELIFRKDQILLELFFSLQAIVLKKKLSIMGGQNGKRIEPYTGLILMVLMFLKTMMVSLNLNVFISKIFYFIMKQKCENMHIH